MTSQTTYNIRKLRLQSLPLGLLGLLGLLLLL